MFHMSSRPTRLTLTSNLTDCWVDPLAATPLAATWLAKWPKPRAATSMEPFVDKVLAPMLDPVRMAAGLSDRVLPRFCLGRTSEAML
jgi:hypothetical protein